MQIHWNAICNRENHPDENCKVHLLETLDPAKAQ